MVERPDIDALLIGALYGELTPADEARLAAHFESHPGDRTALAAMTDTRQAVRESRILQVHFEPPQSVSALLLQEAARRAPRKVEQKEPRENDGWFARFVRSFVAHPAMAAAAMLVLVVGVAGTMYLRKGDQFADKTYSPPTPAAGSAASTATVAAEQPAPSSLEQADALKKEAGSAYGVGLAGKLESEGNRARDEKQEAAKNTGSSYLELKPPVREPKELDERPAKKAPKPTVTKSGAKAGSEDGFAEGRAATGAAKPADPSSAPIENAPQAAPPPPPAAPGAGAPATRSKDKTVTADDRRFDQKAEAKADGSQVVRDLHVRLVNQVKAGNCREAAGLAIQIASRDRAYYLANVEGDRAVKPCIAYITAERERETEKTQKRATQKRADEPAKPSK